MPQKKILHLLFCFCLIWGSFAFGLLKIRNGFHLFQLINLDVIFILVNVFLHKVFCVEGTLPWYALRLMWFSCVMPLQYFSYYVAPRLFDSFGEEFVFGFLGVTVLAPVVIISLIIGFAYHRSNS